MLNPLLFYIIVLQSNSITLQVTVIQLQKNKSNHLLYFFKGKVNNLQQLIT